MAQCLRISFTCDVPTDFLQNIIQKNAKKLHLEGTAEKDGAYAVLIVVCGLKESIDQFVDIIHTELMKKSAENIEMEPFIKEKDYRGVFRIIE